MRKTEIRVASFAMRNCLLSEKRPAFGNGVEPSVQYMLLRIRVSDGLLTQAMEQDRMRKVHWDHYPLVASNLPKA